MSKVQPTNTVISDYEFGRKLYRMCQPYEICTSQVMRDGWNDAENDEAWGLYDDSPAQAIRFSEAALEAASKRNVYEFDNLVQENVFA